METVVDKEEVDQDKDDSDAQGDTKSSGQSRFGINQILDKVNCSPFRPKLRYNMYVDLQCTSDIVATFGQAHVATISEWPLFPTWRCGRLIEEYRNMISILKG